MHSISERPQVRLKHNFTSQLLYPPRKRPRYPLESQSGRGDEKIPCSFGNGNQVVQPVASHFIDRIIPNRMECNKSNRILIQRYRCSSSSRNSFCPVGNTLSPTGALQPHITLKCSGCLHWKGEHVNDECSIILVNNSYNSDKCLHFNLRSSRPRSIHKH
jgi:hypothetical protein